MANQETGKQRKSRIPLDYFKRPDLLARWKLRFTIVIVILAAVWCGAGLLRGGDGLGCSRGPVAAVHATWETNCTVCHEPFAPINTKSWASALFGKTVNSDQKCSACHWGPKHHEEEDRMGCAACHRDHRGRDASLVRPSDSDCTQCHANLKNHVQHSDKAVSFANHITGFHKDHPEFRLIETKAKDPGRLKFNHALHMAEGLTLTANGKPIFTLGMIPASDRARYHGGTNNPAAVQLDCASCHLLDSRDFGIPNPRHDASDPQTADTSAEVESAGQWNAAGLHPARTSGSYMLPIKYEIQCRACHPPGSRFTFDPELPDQVVPHGLEPVEIRKILSGVYMNQFVEQNSKLFDEPASQRPIPGRIVDEKMQSIREGIERKIADAEKILYESAQTCAECHYFQAKASNKVPDTIVATTLTDVWFTHARFDHAAHRAVSCLECHEEATRPGKEEKVLLPGIETCRKCHSPAKGVGGAASGGARFDCTECHRYHNGDRHTQGIGAVARDAAADASIQQFIQGTVRSGSAKSSAKP